MTPVTFHSEDRLTWHQNWQALCRAFPGLIRSPEAQQQGFHERFSKLDQRLVAQAIERAREAKSGGMITVEFLMKGYQRLVPRYDSGQPSMAARIVGWWAMEPRGIGRAHGPYPSLEAARKVARGIPGATVKSCWVKPGDGSWMADEHEGEVLPMDIQRQALARIEALAIALPRINQKSEQWDVPEPGVYAEAVATILEGIAKPPLEPPQTEDHAPEDRASTSEASCRRTRDTSQNGALSSPPYGVNEANGLRLPKHRLPPHLVEQIEKAFDELDRRDDGSPLGATAPGDLAEEGTE